MAPARMVTFMKKHAKSCEICLQDPDLKKEIAKITEIVLPESKIPKAIRLKNEQAALEEGDNADEDTGEKDNEDNEVDEEVEKYDGDENENDTEDDEDDTEDDEDDSSEEDELDLDDEPELLTPPEV